MPLGKGRLSCSKYTEVSWKARSHSTTNSLMSCRLRGPLRRSVGFRMNNSEVFAQAALTIHLCLSLHPSTRQSLLKRLISTSTLWRTSTARFSRAPRWRSTESSDSKRARVGSSGERRSVSSLKRCSTKTQMESSSSTLAKLMATPMTSQERKRNT